MVAKIRKNTQNAQKCYWKNNHKIRKILKIWKKNGPHLILVKNRENARKILWKSGEIIKLGKLGKYFRKLERKNTSESQKKDLTSFWLKNPEQIL